MATTYRSHTLYRSHVLYRGGATPAAEGGTKRWVSVRGVAQVGQDIDPSAGAVTTDIIIVPTPSGPRTFSVFFKAAGSPTAVTFTPRYGTDSEGGFVAGTAQTVALTGGQAVVRLTDYPASGLGILVSSLTGGTTPTVSVWVGWGG